MTVMQALPPVPFSNSHPCFLSASDDPPVRCSRLEPWREASLSTPPSAAARQTLRGLRGGRCLVLRAPRLLRRDLQIAQTVLIMLYLGQQGLAGPKKEKDQWPQPDPDTGRRGRSISTSTWPRPRGSADENTKHHRTWWWLLRHLTHCCQQMYTHPKLRSAPTCWWQAGHWSLLGPAPQRRRRCHVGWHASPYVCTPPGHGQQRGCLVNTDRHQQGRHVGWTPQGCHMSRSTMTMPRGH